MHMLTGGRWWQRAVIAYIGLNIQLGPVLDEDLHHLHMALTSGVNERSISLLSETDTHSERDATACHHTLPTYRQLSIYKHIYTHTFIQYASLKTLAHPYVTVYIHTNIHTVWASMQTALTKIHRSYKQAITFPCTCINTDNHPN